MHNIFSRAQVSTTSSSIPEESKPILTSSKTHEADVFASAPFVIQAPRPTRVVTAGEPKHHPVVQIDQPPKPSVGIPRIPASTERSKVFPKSSVIHPAAVPAAPEKPEIMVATSRQFSPPPPPPPSAITGSADIYGVLAHGVDSPKEPALSKPKSAGPGQGLVDSRAGSSASSCSPHCGVSAAGACREGLLPSPPQVPDDPSSRRGRQASGGSGSGGDDEQQRFGSLKRHHNNNWRPKKQVVDLSAQFANLGFTDDPDAIAGVGRVPPAPVGRLPSYSEPLSPLASGADESNLLIPSSPECPGTSNSALPVSTPGSSSASKSTHHHHQLHLHHSSKKQQQQLQQRQSSSGDEPLASPTEPEPFSLKKKISTLL